MQPRDVRRAHGWNSEHAGTWYIANVEKPKSKQSPLTEYTSIAPTDNVADPHKQTVEIGWNIPETKHASSMRFRVEMTFDNVATSYDDVMKFQWEPVSKDNAVPIGTLTARVHYPQPLDDGDSWAWLHFEGPDSSIHRIDDGFEFRATHGSRSSASASAPCCGSSAPSWRICSACASCAASATAARSNTGAARRR